MHGNELNLEKLAQRLLNANVSEIDLAVGILWLASHKSMGPLSHSEIAKIIHSAGGPRINGTRLRKRLKTESRVISSAQGFKINIRLSKDLDEHYLNFAGPIRPENSGSVLDAGAFESARKYTKNVVWQINASYDNALFDCCAVMCRRLFETLLIDAFDKQGELNLIRDPNGDVLMLSGIIRVLKTQRAFNVGRQTKQAADRLKNIGDWSAHNRTFMARSQHIDEIKNDLFLASSDLLHLSGQD